jgi:hypothetical protein
VEKNLKTENVIKHLKNHLIVMLSKLNFVSHLLVNVLRVIPLIPEKLLEIKESYFMDGVEILLRMQDKDLLNLILFFNH